MPSNSNPESTNLRPDEADAYRRGNGGPPAGALSSPEAYAEFRPYPPAVDAAAEP